MKRCNESFTIWRDGAPVAFTVGQLVDDKHPILKTHKHLFAEPEAATGQATVRQLRPVEEATSIPGEQRTLTPPEQTARQEGSGDKPFDPSDHNGPDVIEYLKGADETERERVIAAESTGKKRTTVLGADLTKE